MMGDTTPTAPPEHLFKDGRAVYLTLQVLSAYVAITLLGASDADLFGSQRQIELPIFGASMSSGAFLWIAPSVIAVLNLFLHMLAADMRRSMPDDIDGAVARKFALGTPFYLRWAFCLSASNGMLRKQYWASLAVAYSLPLGTLIYLWWRTHVIHSPVISSFLALSFLSLVIAHLAVRARNLPKKDSTRWRLIFITSVLVGVLGLGWATYSRTANVDSPLFATAALSRGSLVARPDDYVPRFVWVESYLADAGLVDPEDPMRSKIEDLWFDIRQYALLNGVPHNLDRVDLRRAQMNHTFLPHIFIRGAVMEEAVLTRADMESIDATGTNFRRANLDGAHLEQAFLRNADFTGAQMQKVGLEEAFLSCGNFADAALQDAALDGTFLDRASFQNANMSGASLRGAYAKRTDFGGANLSSVDLTGAILWGSDLSTSTGLIQDQLDGAIGDEETLLPKGLTVPLCAPEIPVQPLPYRRQWWLRIDWLQKRIQCPWTGKILLTPSTGC